MLSFIALLWCSTLVAPAWAEPSPEWEKLERLQPNEQQVQDLFSLFMSQIPYILSDSPNSQRVVEGVVPQALQLLQPDQREFLQQLAPQEHFRRFGEMSREQRTQYVFENARALVHPSAQEWIERLEDSVATPSH